MEGAFYCRSELTAPWGMELPPIPDCQWFHVVTAGRAQLEVGDEHALLEPGDLVLVPHGQGHRLRSEAGAAIPGILDLPREHVSERYEILRHGAGGAPTTMICGAVTFEHPAARNLVAMLPRLIRLEAAGDWLPGTLRLLALEARELRPGSETVITRLSDILVIQALRAWIEHDPGAQTGWLGALRDPQIGAAIALIHEDPAQPWTVALLARELAMSRSAFAARFTELVGEPVIAYLTRWRMDVALAALKEDGATVGEVAARLGYRSEAAFSRAFKRVVGTSPGGVRRAGANPQFA